MSTMEIPVKEPKTNGDYLKNNMFYLGFPKTLNAELEKKLASGANEFQLKFEPTFKKGNNGHEDKMEYKLNFKHGDKDKGDNYFLSNYQATLKQPISEGKTLERSQTFFINQGHGITAKEAYNLLDGRAVEKEFVTKPLMDGKSGEKYRAWQMMDIKSPVNEKGQHNLHKFGENYGFDLKATLAKHPIVELKDPVLAERLETALKRGNLQAVTMDRDGKQEKVLITANPQFKTIEIYNESLQKQLTKGDIALRLNQLEKGGDSFAIVPDRAIFNRNDIQGHKNLNSAILAEQGIKENKAPIIGSIPDIRKHFDLKEPVQKEVNGLKTDQTVAPKVEKAPAVAKTETTDKKNEVAEKPLSKKEIQEVIKQLEKDGAKYVVYPTEIKTATKDDFKGFKTKSEANEHALSKVATDSPMSLKSIKEMKQEVGIQPEKKQGQKM